MPIAKCSILFKVEFFFFFFNKDSEIERKSYLFIYLFIYGCVGSPFLCEGFL